MATRNINLAARAYSGGNYKPVIVDATKALDYAHDPKQRAIAYYWLGLGESGEGAGDATKAAQYESQAVALDPSYAAPHVTLGSIDLRANNLIQALAEANKAVTLDPKYAWGYNLRALVESAQSNNAAAVNDENKAISLDSSQASFKQNLSIIQAR